MKSENEIAKENVEKILKLQEQENKYAIALESGEGVPLKGTFEINDLEIELKTHFESCKRFLKKREEDSKYLHNLVKEGIRGNHFLRYVDKIDKEVKDLQKAIKHYGDNGIK